MQIFRSKLHGFLPLSPVSLTELCSFWYGLKDLFTLHKLAHKLSLTVKTDDVTKGRKDVDPHRRFRGEWVKMHFYLSVNVFSAKVLIGDTIFTSPNGDGTAILRGHPSHAKVSPLAVQRKYLHFSVILRP